MPIYEYVCESGCEFEARKGYNDAIVECPKCGKQATRKGVQKIAGVIFSGGGFTRSGA